VGNAREEVLAHSVVQHERLRDLWLSVSLSVAITVIDVWLLGLAVSPYFKDAGAATAILVVARRSAGVVGLIAAQAAFFFAVLESPSPVRFVALGCFAAVTLLEYGFVAAGGAVMNAQDVPMALQSVRYWPAMMRAFVDWRALLPIGMAAVVLAVRRSRPASWVWSWAVAVAVMCVVHGAYAAAYAKRVQFGDADVTPPPMSAFQSFGRTLTLSATDAILEAREPYRRPQLALTPTVRPANDLVLVIDESISASHLSLDGYARQTTPWLEMLVREGRLTCWDEAAAATVYSNSTFLAIITGFNAFPDTARRVLTLPTLFQFAHASGYRTHFFDGQLAGRRFGLTAADMREIDDWRPVSRFGDDPDTDMRMAREARRVLGHDGAQFVVIVKRGNHEPHEANYPRAAGEWRPSRDGDVPVGEETTARINTYDNAIRYNLDAFFHALLGPDGQLPRTVGFYTSDHGEALGLDGETPLVRKLVPEVATVPLLMFGDARPSVDVHYRASHLNIFPTLLDLMSVPASARPWSYSRSLLAARGADRDARPVLAGYMFGGSYPYQVKEFSELVVPRPVARTTVN
jgi:glucan phosphoethanolaminetransferase (alkaline phosphatase superfamily)